MTIKSGDKIPAVTIKQLTANGMQDFSTDSFFSDKKVVLFAVPGAFTPTCTAKHLPGFIKNLDAFTAQGITVACLAVNGPVRREGMAGCEQGRGHHDVGRR